MIDAVLSYHLNPATCGVAKFNHALAKRLGVPCLPLTAHATHPLVSIKPSELPTNAIYIGRYDLFLHGTLTPSRYSLLVANARRVFAGSRVIADAIRPQRPDVVEAFCPSTVEGNPTRGAYRVLVFGMAHKLNAPHFQHLKEELEREHPDYTIELSTAVHEGNPWDQAFEDSIRTMRAMFGNRLRVLGYLGDDALAKELQEVDAVAAYYVPALRENNTSAWAALAAGKKLYTNTDEHSPVLDASKYSWEGLLRLMA